MSQAFHRAALVEVVIPVVGVRVISQLLNPFVANLTFLITVAVLAMIAMGTGVYARKQAPAQ